VSYFAVGFLLMAAVLVLVDVFLAEADWPVDVVFFAILYT
jgi:hypothetical protein